MTSAFNDWTGDNDIIGDSGITDQTVESFVIGDVISLTNHIIGNSEVTSDSDMCKVWHH